LPIDLSLINGDCYDETSLKDGDLSFWQYLYQIHKGESPELSVFTINSHEKLLAELISGSSSIDTLADNPQHTPAMLMLAKKYYEKGCMKCIYSIMNYYLPVKPENKRILWSIFFQGIENPEIIEKLEHIIMNETDELQFEAALNLLEKIYIKKEDYKTVLFLRTTYSKKIADRAKQLNFIDESILFLEKYLDRKVLIDLYKMRYNLSEGLDKERYLLFMRDVMVEYGMIQQAAKLYENKWREEHNPTDAYYLFELYFAIKEYLSAEIITRELLEINETNPKVVKMLADVLWYSEQYTALIGEINKYKEILFAEENHNKYQKLLVEAYIKTGETEKPIEIMSETVFEDREIKYALTLLLVELLEEKGKKEDSLDLIKSAQVYNETSAIKKLSILAKHRETLSIEELGFITSYEKIIPIIENSLSEDAAQKIVDFFASKDDVSAVELMVRNELEHKRATEARRLLEIIRNSTPNYDILDSMILKCTRNLPAETMLLKRILFKEIERNELYPLLRLKEIYKESRNKKAIYLLESIIESAENKAFDISKWEYFTPIKKETIFLTLEFNETEQNLLDYSKLIANAEKSGSDERKSVEPISSVHHRELNSLLQRYSIQTGADIPGAVYNNIISEPLKLAVINVPVIVFGKSHDNLSFSSLAFLTAQHIFLMNNGCSAGFEQRAPQITAEKLKTSLKLKGPEKVNFIKRLKDSYHADIIESFNMVENTEEYEIDRFARKLHLASLMYAYSMIPDIGALSEILGVEWKTLINKESDMRRIVEFSIQTIG